MISTFEQSLPRPIKALRMYAPISLLIRRPLLDLNASASIADRTAEELNEAIDDGRVLAFNIAVRSNQKRCLRILVTSLAEHLNGAKRPPESPAALLATVSNLFPALAQTIRLENFARTLGCTLVHARHLVEERCVQVAHAGRPARGDACTIHRASAVAFLISRRVR